MELIVTVFRKIRPKTGELKSILKFSKPTHRFFPKKLNSWKASLAPQIGI